MVLIGVLGIVLLFLGGLGLAFWLREKEPRKHLALGAISLALILLVILLLAAAPIVQDWLSEPETAASQPAVAIVTLPPAWTATPAPAHAAEPTPTALVEAVVGGIKRALGIPEDASSKLPLLKKPWLTPVECQKSFNVESAWLICEPGVILDDTAAWTIPGTESAWFINVPEGGFTDFSLGEGNIAIDGVNLNLPGEKGLNYLVVIRGRIDDNIVDNDLNETAKVTDFVPGHAIWAIMPPGAYVSHDWFRQQLVVSTTTGGTNCGASGCSRVRIVLFDVDSHFYQMFEAHAGAVDDWVLLAQN